MKKTILGMAVIIVLFSWTGFSGAAMIVDTGISSAWPDTSGDPVLSSDQWLAVKVTLNEGYFISSAQGYLSSSGNEGTFTIALYTDGGIIPGVRLLSLSAFAPQVVFDTSGNAIPDWHGFSGKDFFLSAGSYWIAFEVLQGDTFSGFMANPAAHPLPYEAIYNGVAGAYWPESYYVGTGPADIGLRIEGNPVPLPGAILLFAPGLAGLAVLRRRFKE
jgi:hypothetical protein